MNKKIAMSAISIVSALTIMGGATFAAFSSPATNPGNTFAAGDIELQINGASGSGSTPVFAVTGIAPGESRVQKLALTNAGSIGSASTNVSGVNDSSTSVSDLGTKLTLQFFDDTNLNGLYDDGVDLPLTGTAHITDGVWDGGVSLGFGLPAGFTHEIFAKVTFDGDADNTFQSSNSTFDITITTLQ